MINFHFIAIYNDMKTVSPIFIAFLITLFISCTQGSVKKSEQVNMGSGKNKNSIDNTLLTLVESENESFDKFLERFNGERTFQLQRIKFPIKATVPDLEDEGMAPIEEVIGKYQWELLDLTYDSSYMTRLYDQYYQEVHFSNDTAILEIRGINNGIFADYYFKLIDKKWYLVTLCEASF